MDAIAVSMSAEPAATPIPSGGSSPPGGSLFGSLMAWIAKDEEQASESSTDIAVDTAALQLDAMPPFLVRQWLMQADSPLLPRGLMSGLESLQENQLHPVTLGASEPEEPVQDEPKDVPASQSGPVARADPPQTAAGANVPAGISSLFESRSASQRALAPTAPFPAGITSIGQQPQSDLVADELTGAATPGLSPGLSTPGPASYASMATITRAGLESRSDDPSQSGATPDAATTDETTTRDEPKTAQTAEAPKPDQRSSSLPASQRAPEPLPQFAINAQPNTPAPTPDGMSASPQPWNVSAAAAGSAEAPLKLALAPRADPAVEMQTLALHIAARSARGDSRFTIKLDPPELGRIEVNLSVTSHGHAQAVVAVEKPQTLDLLLRDAPALERALKDAGLELGGNLSFSLKEEGRPQFTRDNDYVPPGRTLELVPAEGANARSALNAPLLEQLYGLRTARLDITV